MLVAWVLIVTAVLRDIFTEAMRCSDSKVVETIGVLYMCIMVVEVGIIVRAVLGVILFPFPIGVLDILIIGGAVIK